MRSRGRLSRVIAIAAATLLGGALAAWAAAPDRITTPEAAAAALSAAARTTPAAPAPTPEGRGETSGAPSASSQPAAAHQPGASSQPGAAHDEKDTTTTGVTPTKVTIPRLKIEMPVIPTGVDPDGEMEIPPSPLDAGWYRYGPGAGAQRGATVIAAHVDSAGQVGPLASLDQTRQGDEITLRAGAREYRYRIESITRIDKDALDLPGLFDRDRAPRLHLVTCGGRFDRAAGHYEDNVVVVAIPV